MSEISIAAVAEALEAAGFSVKVERGLSPWLLVTGANGVFELVLTRHSASVSAARLEDVLPRV
jgi:hypothetical protein